MDPHQNLNGNLSDLKQKKGQNLNKHEIEFCTIFEFAVIANPQNLNEKSRT